MDTGARADAMNTELDDPVRVAIFYAIALTLALAVALAAPLFAEATPLLTILTPAISVLVMLVLERRRGALAGTWSSLGASTTGAGGWWLALAGPAAVLIAADLVLVAGGYASFHAPTMTGSPLQAAVKAVLGFAIGLVFAFAEEVGWRGYMLPRLASIGLLRAMLVVGFLHGAWHLPLMLLTPYYHAGGNPLVVVPMFLATLTLAGVFYGYLRIRTGSVWPAAIAHAFFNFLWGIGALFLSPASPEVFEYYGGESGILVIAALAVLTVSLRPAIARLSARSAA